MTTQVYDTAAQLLECARAKVAATEAGVPARVCVVPGAELAWDECECGQLTVHVLRQYPSRVFPTEDRVPMAPCSTAYLVAVFAVTILRCVPIGGEDAIPPTCEELDAAARTQADDALAVFNGVMCCIDDGLREFIVLDQPTVGPAGQCAGSQLTIAVGFP